MTMQDLVHRTEHNAAGQRRLKLALLPAIVAVLTALLLFAYLGTFSRYSSDDYCLSAFYYQEADLITNLVQRYNHASSRYTNILFIGFADKVLGWYNPAILPPLMLILFVLGLYLCLDQIQAAGRWGWSRLLSFYLALLIAYLSLLQSPNLYETLYWRAGMTSHFAPVVFQTFLGAFLLKQIRLAGERHPAAWVYAACFLIPFLIGGLSEPPSTLAITVLSLAMAAVWMWGKGPARRSVLSLLSWTLAGTVSALLVLGLAPANLGRLGETSVGLVQAFVYIFQRTFEALIVSVRTLPLPTLFSLVIPALLFYLSYAGRADHPFKERQKQLLILIPIVLLVTYVLIASSFAPSIYAQSFPAARARFAGVVLLAWAFMMIGAIMGILVATKHSLPVPNPKVWRMILVLFVILSLYPLRTAWRLVPEVPVYQQRAAAWDRRDAQIRAMQADGVQDLLVPSLADEPLRDLGDRSSFRLNRCASSIYGVNSILAIPMDEE